MDAELKKKWIGALQSGQYKKGIGCLRDLEDNYCCLGVLADVLYPDEWIETISLLSGAASPRWGHGPSGNINYLHDYAKYQIPFEIQKILGGLNDKNTTFEPVIEYIQNNL